VDKFVGLQIEDQNLRVFLCRDEQTIACGIRGEVIKIAIFEFGQGSCMQEFERSFILRCGANEKDEKYYREKRCFHKIQVILQFLRSQTNLNPG
jgi:hypothetical protein